jgi:ATP-dependent RNA helicase DDX21
VFGSSRIEVDMIAEQLPNARALHGGLAQRQREEVLGDFRRGKFNILVASDVASRGLDIDSVETVIHTRGKSRGESMIVAEDYIHRSGRCGRAGVHGVSVLLHSQAENYSVNDLEREVGITFEKVKLEGNPGVNYFGSFFCFFCSLFFFFFCRRA